MLLDMYCCPSTPILAFHGRASLAINVQWFYKFVPVWVSCDCNEPSCFPVFSACEHHVLVFLLQELKPPMKELAQGRRAGDLGILEVWVCSQKVVCAKYSPQNAHCRSQPVFLNLYPNTHHKMQFSHSYQHVKPLISVRNDIPGVFH